MFSFISITPTNPRSTEPYAMFSFIFSTPSFFCCTSAYSGTGWCSSWGFSGRVWAWLVLFPLLLTQQQVMSATTRAPTVKDTTEERTTGITEMFMPVQDVDTVTTLNIPSTNNSKAIQLEFPSYLQEAACELQHAWTRLHFPIWARCPGNCQNPCHCTTVLCHCIYVWNILLMLYCK